MRGRHTQAAGGTGRDSEGQGSCRGKGQRGGGPPPRLPPGLQTASGSSCGLGLSPRPWAPGLTFSISVFPRPQPQAGPRLPSTQTAAARNEILHSWGDERGGGVEEVSRGAGDPPPGPCASRRTARSSRRGFQAAGGFPGQKERGARGAGVGVPGTRQHPLFPGNLGRVCRSHESSS